MCSRSALAWRRVTAILLAIERRRVRGIEAGHFLTVEISQVALLLMLALLVLLHILMQKCQQQMRALFCGRGGSFRRRLCVRAAAGHRGCGWRAGPRGSVAVRAAGGLMKIIDYFFFSLRPLELTCSRRGRLRDNNSHLVKL